MNKGIDSERTAAFSPPRKELAFDICELSVVSYFMAREYGLPISAIPVVPIHLFHHGDFLKNVHAGIESPRDLAGKRVGTGRRCAPSSPRGAR
jgi:4,5-dihydroxyphthalate decarboxylase